jgi:hypothetical protein
MYINRKAISLRQNKQPVSTLFFFREAQIYFHSGYFTTMFHCGVIRASDHMVR